MNPALTIPAESTPCGSSAAVVTALRQELGETEVPTGSQISAKYLRDWSDERGGVPIALVQPRTTQEVARLLRICHDHGQAVTPQAGFFYALDLGARLLPDWRQYRHQCRW